VCFAATADELTERQPPRRRPTGGVPAAAPNLGPSDEAHDSPQHHPAHGIFTIVDVDQRPASSAGAVVVEGVGRCHRLIATIGRRSAPTPVTGVQPAVCCRVRHGGS